MGRVLKMKAGRFCPDVPAECTCNGGKCKMTSSKVKKPNQDLDEIMRKKYG